MTQRILLFDTLAGLEPLEHLHAKNDVGVSHTWEEFFKLVFSFKVDFKFFFPYFKLDVSDTFIG